MTAEKKRRQTHTGIWKDTWPAAVMCLLFACLLFANFGFYYELNDDVLLRDIVSGIYTGLPDAHAVYMGYPLTYLYATLYTLTDAFPWYAVGMLLMNFLSVFVLMQRVSMLFNRAVWKILACLTVLLGCMATILYQLVFWHYTVTGGFLMAAACILLMTIPEDYSDRRYFRCAVPAILMILLAFCVRRQICLFLLPIVLLALLMRHTLEVRGKRRLRFFAGRYLPTALAILLGIGLCFALNRAAYNSDEWQEYLHYNDVRTELYDYHTIPSYAENSAFYDEAGIDEEQVLLLENYNYVFSDEIDAGLIEKINEYNREREGATIHTLREALWIYVHRLFSLEDAPLSLIILALYLVTAILLIVFRKWPSLIILGLLAGGRSALWLFIILRGRYPDRVTVPLLLAELAFLLGTLLFALREKEGKIRIPVMLVTAVLMLLGSITGWGETMERRNLTEEKCNEWMQLQTFLAEDQGTFHYLDVYSTVAYSERVFDELQVRKMLKTEDGIHYGRNNEIAGGWIAFSPIHAEKQGKFGITDAAESLSEGSLALFVCNKDRSVDWLETLLSDEEVSRSLSETAQCGDFVVYKAVEKK